MKHYPDIPIGLSDHTTSNAACISAIALGAKIVERHYTDKMQRSGPDIVCSMDENTLKELLQAAKDVPQMLGGNKAAIKEEQVTIDFAFASIVSIQPIKKGEKFTEDNLWVKRPGLGGIRAEEYKNVLGKVAAADIAADTQILKEMKER